MAEINLERLGFWGLLAIYVVRDGIIPIATKNFPQFFQRGVREQAREDKQQSFDQQMRLREVEALESIKEFVGATKEFMVSIDRRLDHIEGRLPDRKPKKVG